jgi:transposase
MLAIHPQARTTPAVRAEIARSHESSGVLAKRYGVSTETIRKWRKRGPADCQDRSARPHKLPWKASDEERAIVCALRRSTGFPLDDLTFILTHFLPHLNRDAVYRILKAEGLNRLPPAERTRKPHSAFKDYEVGFIHVDVKHLPKDCTCPSCRIAIASPVRRHRSRLPLRAPGGERRRDHRLGRRLPRRGALSLSLQGHARAD